MERSFKKKKHLGQNFLTNQAIVERIVKESGITSEEGVLEIGPGTGVLTSQLLGVAKKVVAIEVDKELVAVLRKKFVENESFTLIVDDILKTDIDLLLKQEFDVMNVSVCANLPYYITTPILMKLLEGKHGFKSITVMVQKEVAERLTAKPGSKEYGAITASTNYYAKAKKLFVVAAGNFSPIPKVDSAVVRFDLYEDPPVALEDEKFFFEIIKGTFSQRRKIIANSLHSILNSVFTKSEICDILNTIGKSCKARAEELSLEDFAHISNVLYKNLNKRRQDE